MSPPLLPRASSTAALPAASCGGAQPLQPSCAQPFRRYKDSLQGQATPPTGTSASARARVRRAWPVAARGAAVATTSSLLAAGTFCPAFLRASQGFAASAKGALVPATRSLALLTEKLGPAFPWAAMTGALMVLGFVWRAGEPADGRGARLGLLLFEVGAGLCLAPFWQVALAGQLSAALPAVALATAAMVGLHGLTVGITRGRTVGVDLHVAFTGLLAATATVAAKVALGVPPLEVVCSAMSTLAVGALGLAGFYWRSHFGNSDDRGTALVRSTQILDLDPRKCLPTPRGPQATVLADAEELRQAIVALLANKEAGRPVQATFLLHGPAGTGKSETAQALANLGPWPLFQAPTARLYDDPAAVSLLVQWLDEMRRFVRLSGRPAVALLDEAELLFRDRASFVDPNAPAARRGQALVEAFNHELGGVADGKNKNLIVVLSTNHAERLDPSIWARFTRSEDVGATVAYAPPGAAELCQLLQRAFLFEHSKYLGLAYVRPYVPGPERRRALTAALTDSGMTGRQVTYAVQEMLTAANARYGARPRQLAQANFDAFVTARLDSWRTALATERAA